VPAALRRPRRLPERPRRRGNRFVGYDLVWRLLAGGHAVTVFNRGTLADPFGERVERLQGDRTTDEFDRALAGRRFDGRVDFAGFVGRGRRARACACCRAGRPLRVHQHGPGVPRARAAAVAAREADYEGP
jgi:hypothetical protein